VNTKSTVLAGWQDCMFCLFGKRTFWRVFGDHDKTTSCPRTCKALIRSAHWTISPKDPPFKAASPKFRPYSFVSIPICKRTRRRNFDLKLTPSSLSIGKSDEFLDTSFLIRSSVVDIHRCDVLFTLDLIHWQT